MSVTSHKLTESAQKKVVQFINERMSSFDIETRRFRYSCIDKAMQLERNARRKRQKDADQRVDFYDDIEVGMISPAVDTLQGFLVDLYLSQTPIFPAVSSSKDHKKQVLQFNTILENEERDFKWGRHLANYFRALAKYNAGALEVTWHEQFTEVVGTDLDNPNGNAEVTASSVQGNKMRCWNMYNTYYDTTVPLAEVHDRGEFAATVERKTLIDLAMDFSNLEDRSLQVMNQDLAYTKFGANSSKFFEDPKVVEEFRREETSGGGWKSQFNSAFEVEDKNDKRPTSESSKYEVTTFYCRIIPSMFGINCIGKNRVQIFKFVLVGYEVLVYAEQINHAHGYMPVLFSQLREDDIGEQVKSTAELLMPLQNLSSQLYDARLASLARSVNDRMAYVAGVVDEKDVQSKNPVSRIKMRPTALYKDIRSALMPIPFSDNVGNSLLNEIGFIRQTAQETTRLNRPQLGQFQKGNKTLGEFNTVMQNSQAELRVMGVLLENQTITPLKKILKTNIFQYQPAVTLTSTAQQEVVDVNPTEIREAHLEFKLADGLHNQEEFLDLQVAREFLMYVQQDPEVRQRYDMVGLLSYIMTMSGAKISQFEIQQGPNQPNQQPQPMPPQA